jgi:TRAP-type C4-dicarboxylate transport system substrate-binding protein
MRFPRLAAALCAALAFAAPAFAQMPQSLPPGPAVRFTAVTQTLPTNVQYTRVDIPYLRERMQQRTGGRIEVNLATHAERNLQGNEIVRLVRSGQAELGGGTLSTLSGDVPILDGIDLAGLGPDIATARRIAEAMLPVANRDLERFGTRIAFIYPFPGQVTFCRVPVASLADLRGKRVRTFGASLNDLMTAIGAQPVSVAFPEVYSALERGVVDCAITASGSGSTARWWEVSTHVMNLPLSWALTGYIVNLNWWNRLDPQVRTFLEGTFAEMNDQLWQLAAEGTRDGLDCLIGKAEGCRLHTLATRPMVETVPPESDQARLRELLQSTVLPGFVRRCGARCGEVFNQTIAPIVGVRAGG